MKKITSLLMMFMLFVGMGWAQGTTGPEIKGDCSEVYAITNMRGSLMMEDNLQYVTRPRGGKMYSLEEVKNDKHLQWTFYQDTDKNTYLVNVASGEMVIATGSNDVFGSFFFNDKSKAKVTFKASAKSSNGGKPSEYNWVIHVGNQDIHMRNHDQSAHGVQYYDGHPEDQGSQFKIEKIEGVTLTGVKEKVENHLAFALNGGKKVANISELANNKVYHIKNAESEQGRGNFIYHSSNVNWLSAAPKKSLEAWNNAEFALLKTSVNGKYFMYNPSNNKFVVCPNTGGTSAVVLSSTPDYPVTIEPNGANVFNFKSNGTYFGISTSYHNGCIVWNDKNDGGNKFNIIEVEYPWTPIVQEKLNSKVRELNAAEFRSEMVAPHAWLNENIKWNRTKLTLQATDANGDGYIASNAPHVGGADGKGVGELLDGDKGTYFHSRYGGEAVADKHNLTVKFTKPISVFSFAFDKRNDNNRPSKMLISGKVANGNWEPIMTLSTTSLTPLLAADRYESDEIITDKAYNEFKFEVLNTNNGALFGNNPFFTMSEFEMYTCEATVENSANVQAYLDLQKAVVVKNSNILEQYVAGDKEESELVNACAAVLTQIDKLQNNKLLVELESMRGNCQENPELGKYPLAAYNEAHGVLSSDAEIEQKEAAFNKFKASLNSPVYMILSAATLNYCQGVGAYLDGATWKFKKASKFDRSVWFSAYGSLSTTITAGDYTFMHYNTQQNLMGVNSVKTEVLNVEGQTGFYNVNLNNGYYMHCQNTGSKLVSYYKANDLNHASAWKFQYIGNSYDLAKVSDAVLVAAVDMQTFIDSQKGLTLDFGTGYGQYQGSQVEYAKNIAAAEAMLNSKIADLTVEGLQDAKSSLELHLNLPKNGAFLRIKASKNNRGEAYPYLVAENSTQKADRAAFVSGAGTDVKSIFCFNDGKLVAYTNGLQVLNQGGFASINGVAEGAPFAFQTAQSTEAGAYNIVFSSNRYLFAAQGGKTPDLYYYADAGRDADNNGYNFILEAVNELPITFKGNETSGYYATINAPVALTIPAGVTAYTGKKGTNVVNLTPVENLIPANSPVLLKASEAGVKMFPIAYDDQTASLDKAHNDFVGTIATEVRGERGFLGLGFGAEAKTVVGFYNVNAANLKGFRARLNKDNAAVNGLRLNFGEATGIEGVVEELNGKAEIFDLSGRRVVAPKKGLYIVNGKKVYVK